MCSLPYPIPRDRIPPWRTFTTLESSTACNARAALQAGIGHVVAPLIIAAVIWFAGVAVAARFGHFIDTAASVALIAFGGWIAIASLRELRQGAGHGHNHGHGHSHNHDFSFL